MSTRTLFAAGYIPPKHVKATRLARKCSWCNRYMSAEDMRLAAYGASTTHVICPPCNAEHFGPEAA